MARLAPNLEESGDGQMAQLSDILSPEQLDRVAGIIEDGRMSRSDKMFKLKAYFTEIQPVLGRHGISPDYLAYALYNDIT
jgi:hypothetical protein